MTTTYNGMIIPKTVIERLSKPGYSIEPNSVVSDGWVRCCPELPDSIPDLMVKASLLYASQQIVLKKYPDAMYDSTYHCVVAGSKYERLRFTEEKDREKYNYPFNSRLASWFEAVYFIEHWDKIILELGEEE